MQVGTKVGLKVACLGNPAGTVGVVFYNYGDGFQVIFPNGNLDGFSTAHKMPGGQTESEYFLEKVGAEPSLANYQFKNVIQVSQDFRKGLFNIAFFKD